MFLHQILLFTILLSLVGHGQKTASTIPTILPKMNDRVPCTRLFFEIAKAERRFAMFWTDKGQCIPEYIARCDAIISVCLLPYRDVSSYIPFPFEFFYR
jgi:hypothetical protein